MKNVHVIVKGMYASAIVVGLMSAIIACNKKVENAEAGNRKSNIEKAVFGKISDSTSADIYTLTNANEMVVKITNFGGIITSIQTPDKAGKLAEVTLGFDSLASYVAPHPSFGAIVGRYANRIAKGKFTLNNQTYTLAINNGENHLHGGLRGFDKALWKAEIVKSDSGLSALKLTYLSRDMEEGYPGNLSLTVTYTLKNDNGLQIDYMATTDKPTVLNLTNHAYFNLNGAKTDVLAHEVKINASTFTPINKNSIPLGNLQDVKGTPFDFTTFTTIGANINADDEQIQFGNGYDHNFVVDKEKDVLALAATAYEPESGRVLEMYSTEPGVQFYTGNFLDGSLKGKNGIAYGKRFGFCFESQHFPDSPNQADFPTTVLNVGETFHSTTVYKFSVK
ncbi:MAG: aldose epimerase family protein [Cytophagales bacterium]